MSRLFDTIVIVDWSSRGTPSPAVKSPDAIWIAVHGGLRGIAEPPEYFRTRLSAMSWLGDLLAGERAAGRRVLAGFDFPFGYPRGFALAVTGRAEALAVWAHLADLIEDGADNANNRFHVAARLNASLPGTGPFWGRPETLDLVDLPARGSLRRDNPFPERRIVEQAVRAAQPCWKLYTTGAVGGQMLTGLPALERLRRDPRLSGAVAVWPLETGLAVPRMPIVLAEVYPSLVAATVPPGGIKDQAQVRAAAAAFAALDASGDLAPLFAAAPGATPADRAIVAREEGWILGAGHETALRAAGAMPALRNDCFALPPGIDWVPVDDALARLRDGLAPTAPVETLRVELAGGRILAGPVIARRAHPPFANAAVDGYGFAHGSLGPGPHLLALAPGRAAAGAPYPGAVPPGSAVRILTGAMLPPGVDTIVLDEDAGRETGAVRFAQGLRAGANTRALGEDIAAGHAILPAGHRLMPQDLGTAVSAGVAEMRVHRRLRVGVLSTGDEVRPAGSAAAPHEIFDANRPMLLEMIRRWDMAAVDLGHAADTQGAVAAAFDRGAAETDAVLATGGASAGDEDHVSRLLRDRGALATWRIAVKPGRPLALGVWSGVPVFGLPGNPVAAFVCALIFARPALGLLAGGPWRSPRGHLLPAAFEKSKKPGRREYLRARPTEAGSVEVFASEGSGRISGLTWARGLVELDEAARTIRPGDAVRYLPFAEFDL